MNITKIKEIGSALVLKKINDNSSLWHAINIKNAVNQLQKGIISAHTKQRYWKDGKRYKDDHPEYENSFWMYGWSMTRNREYAENWNSVVFEFDKNKIGHHFKIIPFAWNYLFQHKTKFEKKEFEEFVLAKKIPISIQTLKENENNNDRELDALYDEISSASQDKKIKLQEEITKLEILPNWFNNWNSPKGKSIELDKCLKGIYINEDLLNEFKNEDIKYLLDHPLYKGTFRKDSNKNIQKKLKT